MGDSPWSIAFQGYTHGIMGDLETAREAVRDLERAAKTTFVPDALIGTVWFAAGDREKALSLFEKAFQERSFFFSSRRRHTISVSAFLLNRSSDLVCLSMVQLMAVFISMRCTLCGHFLQVALTLLLVVGYAIDASSLSCKIRALMVTVCPS